MVLTFSSSTRYRGQLFESKVTLELYSVNPVRPCLIILLFSIHYRSHQKSNLNKLLQQISIIYSFDGLGIRNRNISVTEWDKWAPPTWHVQLGAAYK